MITLTSTMLIGFITIITDILAALFGFPCFGTKNPTKHWQRINDLRLNCELEDGTLNGVKLGEPLDRLFFLGPVEDRSGLQLNEYRYFSLGLSIGCDNAEDTIDCFELIRKDADAPQHRPYSGLCHYRGRNLALEEMDEQMFLNDFGSPYWRDEDDEDIILFYEFPGIEWQVELGLDGTFNRIMITCKPTMADDFQRNAYGVTKPWPPEVWNHQGWRY